MKLPMYQRLLIVLTQLPEVPPEAMVSGNAKAVAMLMRSCDGHSCALCGMPADLAIIAGPGLLTSVARWLDLCARCGRELRIEAEAWTDEDESEIIDQMARDGLIMPL